MKALASSSIALGCSLWLWAFGCGGRIDTEPFGFVTPGEGEAVEGEVPIELAFGFNGLEQGVRFVANGEPIDEDQVRPYQTRLDTRALPEGELVLEVFSLDSASAHPAEPLSSVRVIVDNQGPAITLAQPKAIACVRPGERLTISALVTDHVGVESVDLRIAAESVAHLTKAPFEHALVLETGHFTGEGADGRCVLTVGAENQRGLISNQTLELPRCGG